MVLRPRLCHMRKGSKGYGFNLHTDKNKAGQFIRAVDEDSPAQRAGLRAKDKIIQVCNVQVLLIASAAPGVCFLFCCVNQPYSRDISRKRKS